MGLLAYLLLVSLGLFGQFQAQTHNENFDWKVYKYNSGSQVIGTWDYLEKVTRKMVEIFERKHVSGTNLPIIDQIHNINETVREFHAEGKVALHAGFVNKIKSISDIKNHEKWAKDKIILSSKLYLDDVSVVYDADLEFDGTRSTGTIIFVLPRITFDLAIEEDIHTKELNTTLNPWKFNCSTFKYKAHPYDHYMQMAVKGLQKSKTFCENLQRSMLSWKIKDCLDEAVQEIGFAPVCYYCDKTQHQ